MNEVNGLQYHSPTVSDYISSVIGLIDDDYVRDFNNRLLNKYIARKSCRRLKNVLNEIKKAKMEINVENRVEGMTLKCIKSAKIAKKCYKMLDCMRKLWLNVSA